MTADHVSLNSFLVNYKVGLSMPSTIGITMNYYFDRIIIGITHI